MGVTIAIIFSQSLNGSEAFGVWIQWLGGQAYFLRAGICVYETLSTVQEQECVWDFILIDSK